ncbi:MAG: chromosome segregation protein SMC [Planctomycetota bacterium]|nr:MAG: chromosome segregation protein SMC [Planctomycetota bacterium]
MLIALELAGFKSFADKTRFDFPDGITVIVGPNGSGKSNVVDAIKWVLGAQSAKSLRGKEMLDVIFKGSASSGRKPANSAEATLIFDNSKRQLPVDAEQVQVTRRVYRSGEGEYLINGQACRLKDIKNLFRGTGVGVDAYSLIEQGKVDRMLQASPKDRRVIFEEAAGISRFNAKKAEAARRLQRVEQNLTRLRDIVDEVHTRLRTLQTQASKAQRYREMTARLQEVRMRLGHTELQELEHRLATARDSVTQLNEQLERQQQAARAATAEARQAELHLHKVASACQSVDNQLQEVLQRIAVARNEQTSLHRTHADNAEQWQRMARRLATLRARRAELVREVERIRAQNLAVEQAFQQALDRKQAAEHAVRELREKIAAAREHYDSMRRQHVDLLREHSEAGAEISKKKSLLRELDQTIEETGLQLTNNRRQSEQARAAADSAAQRLKEIHRQSNEASAELDAARQDLETHRQQLTTLGEQAATLKERLSATTERLEILQELERHLEGVDSGAQRLLEMAHSSADPVFQSIRGLVAEQFDADVNVAPLVDTALGQRAGSLVLADGRLIDRLRRCDLEIPGRLTLLRLDSLPTKRFGERIQLDGVPGVIGRADQLVRFSPDNEPLIRYLLGTTWLVESLDVALELGHFRGAGLRFVTAACELLESDGTLTLGALQSASGLVSRRSEIKIAQVEIEELKEKLQRTHGDIARLSSRVETLSPRTAELEREAKRLAQELARQQATAQNAVAKLDALEVDGDLLEEKLRRAQQRHDALQPEIEAAQQRFTALQSQIAAIEQSIAANQSTTERDARELEQLTELETTAKIELAKMEQQRQSALDTLIQAESALRERHQAVQEGASELHRLSDKRQAIEMDLLRLESALADDFSQRERLDAELTELALQAEQLQSTRAATARQADRLQRNVDKLQQQIDASDNEIERCRDSIRALLSRYAEDYRIDEARLRAAEPVEDAAERQQLHAEATQLRHDVASVGEINMAALAELDELQSRYDHLHGQYEDLVAAKESLQRIIHKINQDSRRMFLETLEIIRQNFQKLYRKSFGGGNADIVLEEGEDVLECGIDIIATPPGKTALSNSLLSGGEKALTAVALLLAIFQYRPSPFCVLDEVDAPFDEANIGRFVNVLHEFLDWTKFIIVTHSKKTMTAATTLYGVTMQESGVSKQVAVRFEDVNEKGEIVTNPRRQAA